MHGHHQAHRPLRPPRLRIKVSVPEWPRQISTGQRRQGRCMAHRSHPARGGNRHRRSAARSRPRAGGRMSARTSPPSDTALRMAAQGRPPSSRSPNRPDIHRLPSPPRSWPSRTYHPPPKTDPPNQDHPGHVEDQPEAPRQGSGSGIEFWPRGSRARWPVCIGHRDRWVSSDARARRSRPLRARTGSHQNIVRGRHKPLLGCLPAYQQPTPRSSTQSPTALSFRQRQRKQRHRTTDLARGRRR
jgi:hypothetical protein